MTEKSILKLDDWRVTCQQREAVQKIVLAFLRISQWTNFGQLAVYPGEIVAAGSHSYQTSCCIQGRRTPLQVLVEWDGLRPHVKVVGEK